MNQFPDDCCDDIADLFTHFLYNEYGVDSIRVDGTYYDRYLKHTCGHSWQVTEGFVVDLTGDQFNDNPAIPIKAKDVYVGHMGEFHRQFSINRNEHSCGIESLPYGSQKRMYNLYNSIMKYMN